jgi:hypothetical protein
MQPEGTGFDIYDEYIRLVARLLKQINRYGRVEYHSMPTVFDGLPQLLRNPAAWKSRERLLKRATRLRTAVSRTSDNRMPDDALPALQSLEHALKASLAQKAELPHPDPVSALGADIVEGALLTLTAGLVAGPAIALLIHQPVWLASLEAAGITLVEEGTVAVSRYSRHRYLAREMVHPVAVGVESLALKELGPDRVHELLHAAAGQSSIASDDSVVVRSDLASDDLGTEGMGDLVATRAVTKGSPVRYPTLIKAEPADDNMGGRGFGDSSNPDVALPVHDDGISGPER